MHSYPDSPGRLRLGTRLALIGGLLALEIALAAPSEAARQDDADLGGVVVEFRQICGKLDAARGALRAGAITGDDFADRVLELFVRADSLSQRLPRGGWVQGSRGGGAFALSRAVRYLIESLRQNYVGIAAGDGINFVEADRAYQAAVAWRSGVEAAAAPAAR
jgi:hypothetical protein